MKIKLNNILLDSRIITKYLTDSRKSILLASTTILLTTVIILSIIISPSSVSAESFQSNELLQFTFNPTISINISGSLIIEGLNPGDAKDSNIITVAIESNGIAGYNLYANTGNSSNNSNELRKDGVDTANKFSSITTDKSSLSDFTDNTWGYSYSTDSGSTWTDYSSLPKYSDGNDKQLLPTTTPDTTNLQFKIAAKASTTQLAGEYTNVVNFIGIARPNPEPIYIQDITLAQCQKNVGTNGNPENIGDNITVIDRRDNNIYTVRYINGECWMTQNLRITGVISAADSNFTGDDFNVSKYTIDSSDPSYTGDHCSHINGYNYACAKKSENMEIGAWYNYYAATAGTISTNSNTNEATNDICPTAWHLPSGPNTTEGTDLNRLIDNTTSGWQSATTGAIAFGAINGGIYNYNTHYNYYLGGWWSSTAIDVGSRSYLYYDSSKFSGSHTMQRFQGFYIRCVKSS